MRWVRVALSVVVVVVGIGTVSLTTSAARSGAAARSAAGGRPAAAASSVTRHFGRRVVIRFKRKVDAGQLPPPKPVKGVISVEPKETSPRTGRPRTNGVIALRPRHLPLQAGRRLATIAGIVGGPSAAGLTIDGKVPPDTQLAVGTSRVMEAVNDSAEVFNRSGTELGSFDLGTLFDGSPGVGTDPKLGFDAATRTFFAVYLTPRSGSSEIDLGVTTDPLGTWTIYTVHVENRLQDQPKLGFSSDKIVLAWNDNGNSGPEEYQVIQKAGVIARLGTVPGTIWGPDSSRLNVVPAVQLSRGNTAFAIYHNYNSASVGVLSFTGVPGVSSVSFTEVDRGVARTSAPPPATQPPAAGKATSQKLDTGDDRLESAVWRAGELWAAGNDTCRFRTDTASRSCLRVIHVLTSSMTLTRDVDITTVGGDAMYPAVVLDSANDIWIAFSSVSRTQFASAEIAEADHGTIGSSIGAAIYGAGSGDIDYSACTSPPVERFGDYTGAAIDPLQDAHGVWAAAEFGIAGCSWGTQVAAFTP